KVLLTTSSNRSELMRLNIEWIDWPVQEKHYQPEFSLVEGQTFETERVHVDNHQYGKCRFVNCTFVYSGGPFGFHECEVEGDFYLALTGARRSADLSKIFHEYAQTGKLPY